MNFHPLEVVGRGSETQLQVSGNLNYLIYLEFHVTPLFYIFLGWGIDLWGYF